MSDEDEIRRLLDRARSVRKVSDETQDGLLRRSILNHAGELENRAKALEAQVQTLPPAAAIPAGEPPIAHSGVALKPEVALEPEPEWHQGGPDSPERN